MRFVAEQPIKCPFISGAVPAGISYSCEGVMINPALASIIVNSYNYVRWLRETIAPNELLLDTTTIHKRDEKRCRVVARSSVDTIFCGHEGLQEPECASWC